MPVNVKKTVRKIDRAVRKGNWDAVRGITQSMHPSEIASLIQASSQKEKHLILEALDVEVASEVYFQLNPEERVSILKLMGETSLIAMAEEMESDDAADFLGELAEDVAKKVLEAMDPEEREEVTPLLKYPQDSAGGIMQTEVLKSPHDATSRETIELIRQIEEEDEDDVEDLHMVYVVNETGRLVGRVFPLKLSTAAPDSPLWTIMDPVEITVIPEMDQEEVARIFRKYDEVSLPVVDNAGVLLGRITADDILDVISEEAGEDIYKLGGITGEGLHPVHTSIYDNVRLRAPWIMLALAGELVLAIIIMQKFQTTLENFIVLAALLPLVMATGGNVGVQTNTITVRTIAAGDFFKSQIKDLLLGELKVGLVLGIISGILGSLIGLLLNTAEADVTRLFLVIFAGIVGATLTTSFLGVAGPLVLNRLKMDPAVSSGPFLVTFNDIFGSAFYLFLGAALL
ncbi:MAG: magnesium transporter [Candidatus Dadabacteria bacterium]|nr:magnesium transporter [Candidatus Dadabacteria bacterium]MYE60883.1 magnesium transporter [Candidatus Dadabacteria bacterium]MYI73000.1 magnesium transporter [Candidatus Dadabacteria bacterium]